MWNIHKLKSSDHPRKERVYLITGNTHKNIYTSFIRKSPKVGWHEGAVRVNTHEEPLHMCLGWSGSAAGEVLALQWGREFYPRACGRAGNNSMETHACDSSSGGGGGERSGSLGLTGQPGWSNLCVPGHWETLAQNKESIFERMPLKVGLQCPLPHMDTNT